MDFESVLERQPQKSGVARRGSAIRNAAAGGVESLRRVGGERIAEGRDRVQALRERVPSSIPQPRPGRPAATASPLPRGCPAGSAPGVPRKPKPGRIKKLRLLIILVGLGAAGDRLDLLRDDDGDLAGPAPAREQEAVRRGQELASSSTTRATRSGRC